MMFIDKTFHKPTGVDSYRQYWLPQRETLPTFERSMNVYCLQYCICGVYLLHALTQTPAAMKMAT